MKKILGKIDVIYSVIIYINVILLNIFVGGVHDDPRVILESTIILEALIYIVISKIQGKKNVLIKGKIDIAVTLMVGITAIPLIFRTYCSLSDTIDIFIQYITIYSMYIMVRNTIITEKRKNIFINITLASSVIIVIFGMDRLNFNVFKKFYDLIKSSQVKDWRMVSVLGYANAVFAYITALIIIALGKFLSTENKMKAGIYAAYIQMGMFGFYYSNSRAGMVIFALLFIAYLINLKDTKKMISAFFIILFTYGLTVIFDKIKIMYCTAVTIPLEMLATLIIAYFGSIVISKLSNKVKLKNSKKTIGMIVVVLLIILLVYLLIAQNFSTPKKMETKYDYVTLYRLKFNKKYNVRIDYSYEGREGVNFRVLQVDNKRNEKILYEDLLEATGENLTTKFTIQTGEVDYAMLEFYAPEESKLTFNKIYLDGKEEILNYKYLPNDIMRLIQTFKMGNISISERISMYKSGLELFTLHPIFGNGARTYNNMFIRVREYAYTTMEVHSYYLDILMDYGIIGLAACLGIIIITIYNYTKRKEKNDVIKQSIFFGWLFIAIHTMVDFDLAYLVTIVNFFLLIALINEEDINIKINTKYIELAATVIMAIVLIVNILKIPGEKLYNKFEYEEAMKYIPYSKNNMYKYINTQADKEDVDIIIKYLSNEKNQRQYEMLKRLFNISKRCINDGKIESGIRGIEKIIEMIKKDQVLIKHDVVMKEQWADFVKIMRIDMEEMVINTNNEKLITLKKEIDKIV